MVFPVCHLHARGDGLSERLHRVTLVVRVPGLSIGRRVRRGRDRSNRNQRRRRIRQDATSCRSEGFIGPNVPKGSPVDFTGEIRNFLNRLIFTVHAGVSEAIETERVAFLQLWSKSGIL
jgi:hypothetical protein